MAFSIVQIVICVTDFIVYLESKLIVMVFPFKENVIDIQKELDTRNSSEYREKKIWIFAHHSFHLGSPGAFS